MSKFLLWCVLLFLCPPLAVLAIVVYPLVWLISLPFRLIGGTVSAAVDLVLAVVLLPFRLGARVLKALG